MTQKALANAANISQPYLYDLEMGARGAKEETIRRIADALNVSVEELKSGGTVPDSQPGG